jgi:hypothetical protein
MSARPGVACRADSVADEMTRWLDVPVDATLAAAAFGADPGCWPLPTAATPPDRWLRAVAAGGQGRYGCATTDLADLRRRVRTGPLVSLALSTHASFLRQLGGHALARGWDGHALALAGADPQACVDSLVGLAADALGLKRFAASAALLNRAQAVLSTAANELGGLGAPAERLPIRLAWVSAELAMVSGDGVAAVRHAERARELAAASSSLRHRVKTGVVLAAALCSSGRLEQARQVADEALIATERLGLVPLRWAVASLLVDLGSRALAPERLVAVRDACAVELQRRGGTWYR